MNKKWEKWKIKSKKKDKKRERKKEEKKKRGLKGYRPKIDLLHKNCQEKS